MKMKVFTLLAVLLLMGSAAFSQDMGNPDSLKMVVVSAPLVVGTPSQPFTIACSTYIDANTVTTLQFAFTWNYVDMVIDSVKASAAFEAMEIGPFYYLDEMISRSNDSDIAFCSGTSLFTNFPSNANYQHVATIYFTVNNWSASRGSITVDTIQHPDYASTDYAYVNNAVIYKPIWKGPINVSTSAVDESDVSNIPTSFELEQNFPNPFNPTTSIKFGLPTKSHVSVKVYNLLGQEITTLVNEDLSAGTHTTEWDGRDKNQTEVASGIYFYKLIAGDFIDTKKMMLIK